MGSVSMQIRRSCRRVYRGRSKHLGGLETAQVRFRRVSCCETAWLLSVDVYLLVLLWSATISIARSRLIRDTLP